MSNEEEVNKIAKEIAIQRNLPYTVKIEKVEGKTYYCRSSWGNHIVYVKKKDRYFLESEV